MSSVKLRELAHARSGDKGGSANVGVIAYTAEGYAVLAERLTAECVESFFMPMGVGRVVRYEMPNLLAFNFVLPGVLQSGGGTNLRLDAQGKALGQALLALELDVPEELLARARRR